MAAPILDFTDATEYNIPVFQGRTLDKTVVFKVFSGDTEGYFDFSNYSGATMELKIKTTDSYPVLKLTTENGGLTIDDSDHSIRFYHEDIPTKAGQYYYDLYLRYGSGLTYQLLFGMVYLKQKVSE